MPGEPGELLAQFVRSASEKLAGGGQAEANIRSPLEQVVKDLAATFGMSLVLSDEHTLAGKGVRPDWSAHVDGALCGFVEAKAPGKGADPDAYTGHDREQWEQLRDLPNLLLSDGIEWALYRSGEPHSHVVRLSGSLADGTATLDDPTRLASIVEVFCSWEPIQPPSARALAEVSARLCRLLRREVEDRLQAHEQLRAHAEEWRALLFADASDDAFANGFAQTVTFALLLARVEEISFTGTGTADDLHTIARSLSGRHELIGKALELLTDATVLTELGVSVDVLVRVLSVVDWAKLTKKDPHAWLLFYEDFLAAYDPALRRQTGSYYTQQPLVDAIVRLADDLVEHRLDRPQGLADPGVTILDPACGTGTFPMSVLRRVATRVAEDGSGLVPGAVSDLVRRLFGFEIQVGPYTVAAMRVAAELKEHGVSVPREGLGLYVTNTVEDHRTEVTQLGAMYAPLTRSRQQANRVKGEVPVLVVIGNPPYKERSHGEGGWIEKGVPDVHINAPLADWLDTDDPAVSPHLKHLYNPYVYFWRWAAWKVFEHHLDGAEGTHHGIIGFVSVAGFLAGPGFGPMREWLRRHSDSIYVIDLSPEGHRPPVSTRLFPEVQQPVCVCIALRTRDADPDVPAEVLVRSVAGRTQDKYDQLATMTFDDAEWTPAAEGWQAPFRPAPSEEWSALPDVDALLMWSGTGVMAGRTWVYAPDPSTLETRWRTLVRETNKAAKRRMFKPHGGGDRTLDKVLRDDLPGYAAPEKSVGDEPADAPVREPLRVAFRSFDRQYIIPDKRLINRPNPALWSLRDVPGQVFLTSPGQEPPIGPSVTFTSLLPDLHHYRGRGGRIYPMWLDTSRTRPNIAPSLLTLLSDKYGRVVTVTDVFAYLGAVLAAPAFAERFADDLRDADIHVPVTESPDLFERAVKLGSRVIWLHTFGERYADAADGRPPGSPRAPAGVRPRVQTPIAADGTVPDAMEYDADARELRLGGGTIAPVQPEVWEFQVGPMNVLRSWFDYRRANPDTRASRNPAEASVLDGLTHLQWPLAFSTDLIEVLNVLTLLVDVAPDQADLLEDVLSAPLLALPVFTEAGALPDAGDPLRNRPNIETGAQGTLELG